MHEPADRDVVAKVFWRLLPFSTLLFVIAAIDRNNVGFAALQMNQALGFSPAVFGFAAGVFFIGYALFEIPSNLILERTSARFWISRIMITWGLVVVLTAWTTGEYSFYLLRFLLGVAEAGFVPGMIFYLHRWIPPADRARCFAVFLMGPVLGSIIGGPLAGALMGLHGFAGLQGWQWLFLLEGLPAVGLGVAVAFYLTERPQEANWLTAEEKRSLLDLIESQERRSTREAAHRFSDALKNAGVWQLTWFVFCVQAANYGVILWLPQILRGFGQLTTLQIGFLASGPFLLAAVCMVLWGRHSDATGERPWHIVIAVLVGSAGLATSALAGDTTLAYAGLCVAAAGITASFGVFWALPGEYIKGAAAAGGLALINSIGLMGGFVGPYVVGFIRDRSSGFTAALLVLAGFAALSTLSILVPALVARPVGRRAGRGTPRAG